jgi:Holliday junction DNA helicase RuvA
MIDTIRGIITDVRESSLVVETGGIGYRVHVTPTLAADATPGDEIELYTSFIIREERQYLYGFQNRIERELFDVLLTVSGIGAKTALALLGLQAEQLIASITSGDDSLLTEIPGIGAKTAKRVILELRDRLGKQLVGEYEALATQVSAIASGDLVPSDISSEALQALINLGLDRTEALRRLRHAKAAISNDASLEEILREAFKLGE